MQTELVWITPQSEELLVYMARVSNPESAERGNDPEGLIKYLIRHKHWSPFGMVHACISVKTTRDIARQMLRHRSFEFQEFSQRYAEVKAFETREARLQDTKNRQSSSPNKDLTLASWWELAQNQILDFTASLYKTALDYGIAKEVARAVLPEGLTQSHLYMCGSFRSWLHYIELRTGNGTQLEHQDVANSIHGILKRHAPSVF